MQPNTTQTTINGSTVTNSDTAETIIETTDASAGFNLTSFDDEAAGWSAVLDEHGLEYVGERNTGNGYLWSDGNGVTVTTKADPFTGELDTGDEIVRRDIGYASYIMVFANSNEKVQDIVDTIVTNAEYVKGGSYTLNLRGTNDLDEKIPIKPVDYDVDLPRSVTNFV